MKLWLSDNCALKLLEAPSLYDTGTDELYDLDSEGFDFLKRCAAPEGAEAPDSDFTRYCLDEGILVTSPVSVNRPPLYQSTEPSLRYLELQITRRCNLSCGHCYLGPSADTELPADIIRSVLSEFERMQGLRVLLTGGEPLLHREFMDSINPVLPEFALRYVLFTNGILLTDRVLSSLNVEEIQVSIDGIDASHDALRGKGSYRAALGAVKRALSKGFEVSVSTMVHPANLGDFEPMDKMFRDLGIRDWTVDVPCPEGNLGQNPGHSLTPEEAGRYLSYGYGGAMHGGDQGWGCGRHLMSVMADGACAKCAFYSASPTGMVSDGLDRCWQAVRHYRLSELDCDCQFLEECRGGCRYRALLMGGETGRDLYRCALYGKI